MPKKKLQKNKWQKLFETLFDPFNSRAFLLMYVCVWDRVSLSVCEVSVCVHAYSIDFYLIVACATSFKLCRIFE